MASHLRKMMIFQGLYPKGLHKGSGIFMITTFDQKGVKTRSIIIKHNILCMFKKRTKYIIL